jgi:hypothetical protein
MSGIIQNIKLKARILELEADNAQLEIYLKDERDKSRGLEAELEKHRGECVYDPDDRGTMDTGCGNCSSIPNNSQRFCTWCGKPIRLSWEKSPMGTLPSDIEKGY